MNLFSRRPLSTQIAISVASVTAIVVVILTSIFTVRSQLIAEQAVEREMRSVMRIYERELQRTYAAVTERGRSSMLRFIETLGGRPEMSEGILVDVYGQKGVQSLSTMRRWNLTGEAQVLDEFQQMTGVDSVIFVKHQNGWVRATTQMLDSNGRSLMGTMVEATDPIEKLLNAGVAHTGLQQQNGEWRMLVLEPLIDMKGQVYGGLMLSLDVSEDISPLLNALKQDVVAEHGAVGVVSKNTHNRWYYLAGPQAGQLVSDSVAAFLNGTVVEQKQGLATLKLSGDEEGESLIAWSTIPGVNWVIYASGLKSDFMSSARETTLIMVVMLLGGTVVIVCVAIWMTRRLIAPVKTVVNRMELLSQGDLRLDHSIKVVEGSRNEVDQLLRALVITQRGIAQVVDTIRESAESIRESAANIVAGNNNLSERTEIQAAGLEQTSASMAEIASTVDQTAANSQVARQLTEGATEKASRGDAAMQEVVTAMEQISGSSGKIADIVGVIESIAFQTNILAINAAVEAARAGEHGRGFAVVANEVRTLSQRSANASKEIKALIKDSIANVESGSERVQATRVSMADLVESVREVNSLVAEITTATTEQSVGIRQITQAVTQMDTATQQNTVLVNESALAADDLAAQAETLTTAVRSFKL